MMREVFTMQQLLTLQEIVKAAIDELIRFKEWTAAPDKIRDSIREYEEIQRALITYTVDRRIIDDAKSKSEGLRQGEKAGEPVA